MEKYQKKPRSVERGFYLDKEFLPYNYAFTAPFAFSITSEAILAGA